MIINFPLVLIFIYPIQLSYFFMSDASLLKELKSKQFQINGIDLQKQKSDMQINAQIQQQATNDKNNVNETIKIKSQYLNQYLKEFNTLNSTKLSKLIQTIQSQKTQIFPKHNILYHKSTFKQPSIKKLQQTQYNTINKFQVNIGYFTLIIHILNLNQQKIIQNNIQNKNYQQGSFGKIGILRWKKLWINLMNIFQKESIFVKNQKFIDFVYKVIQFKSVNLKHNKKYNYSEIQLNIFQYCYCKLASALGVGITVLQPFGFDLICYQNCMQFFMEKGTFLNQVSSRLYSFEKVKEDLYQNLKILHNYNSVHNDIKIENIVFSKMKNRFVFIDFGMSQTINVSIGFKKATHFKGSCYYASEQMKNLISKKIGYIDLYWNDLYCLKKSLYLIESNYFTSSEWVSLDGINDQRQYQDYSQEEREIQKDIQRSMQYMTKTINKTFIISKTNNQMVNIEINQIQEGYIIQTIYFLIYQQRIQQLNVYLGKQNGINQVQKRYFLSKLIPFYKQMQVLLICQQFYLQYNQIYMINKQYIQIKYNNIKNIKRLQYENYSTKSKQQVQIRYKYLDSIQKQQNCKKIDKKIRELTELNCKYQDIQHKNQDINKGQIIQLNKKDQVRKVYLLAQAISKLLSKNYTANNIILIIISSFQDKVLNFFQQKHQLSQQIVKLFVNYYLQLKYQHQQQINYDEQAMNNLQQMIVKKVKQKKNKLEECKESSFFKNTSQQPEQNKGHLQIQLSLLVMDFIQYEIFQQFNLIPIQQFKRIQRQQNNSIWIQSYVNKKIIKTAGVKYNVFINLFLIYCQFKDFYNSKRIINTIIQHYHQSHLSEGLLFSLIVFVNQYDQLLSLTQIKHYIELISKQISLFSQNKLNKVDSNQKFSENTKNSTLNFQMLGQFEQLLFIFKFQNKKPYYDFLLQVLSLKCCYLKQLTDFNASQLLSKTNQVLNKTNELFSEHYHQIYKSYIYNELEILKGFTYHYTFNYEQCFYYCRKLINIKKFFYNKDSIGFRLWSISAYNLGLSRQLIISCQNKQYQQQYYNKNRFKKNIYNNFKLSCINQLSQKILKNHKELFFPTYDNTNSFLNQTNNPLVNQIKNLDLFDTNDLDIKELQNSLPSSLFNFNTQNNEQSNQPYIQILENVIQNMQQQSKEELSFGGSVQFKLQFLLQLLQKFQIMKKARCIQKIYQNIMNQIDKLLNSQQEQFQKLKNVNLLAAGILSYYSQQSQKYFKLIFNIYYQLLLNYFNNNIKDYPISYFILKLNIDINQTVLFQTRQKILSQFISYCQTDQKIRKQKIYLIWKIRILQNNQHPISSILIKSKQKRYLNSIINIIYTVIQTKRLNLLFMVTDFAKISIKQLLQNNQVTVFLDMVLSMVKFINRYNSTFIEQFVRLCIFIENVQCDKKIINQLYRKISSSIILHNFHQTLPQLAYLLIVLLQEIIIANNPQNIPIQQISSILYKIFKAIKNIHYYFNRYVFYQKQIFIIKYIYQHKLSQQKQKLKRKIKYLQIQDLRKIKQNRLLKNIQSLSKYFVKTFMPNLVKNNFMLLEKKLQSIFTKKFALILQISSQKKKNNWQRIQ